MAVRVVIGVLERAPADEWGHLPKPITRIDPRGIAALPERHVKFSEGNRRRQYEEYSKSRDDLPGR